MNNDTPPQAPENEVPNSTLDQNTQSTQQESEITASTIVAAQPTSAIGSNSPQPNKDGVWVSKDTYAAQAESNEKQRNKAKKTTLLTRTFYIMLGIAGVIFAVFVIADLIAPAENNSRGCNSSLVYEISRVAAPLFMIYLLATGIIGAIVSKWYVRTIGIILIVLSTFGFFFTALAFLLSSLCGI